MGLIYFFFFVFLGVLRAGEAADVLFASWLAPADNLLTGFGGIATGVRTGKAGPEPPALRLAKQGLQ